MLNCLNHAFSTSIVSDTVLVSVYDVFTLLYFIIIHPYLQIQSIEYRHSLNILHHIYIPLDTIQDVQNFLHRTLKFNIIIDLLYIYCIGVHTPNFSFLEFLSRRKLVGVYFQIVITPTQLLCSIKQIFSDFGWAGIISIVCTSGDYNMFYLTEVISVNCHRY